MSCIDADGQLILYVCVVCITSSVKLYNDPLTVHIKTYWHLVPCLFTTAFLYFIYCGKLTNRPPQKCHELYCNG